jgi:anti-sigma factor RsiW
MTTEERRRLRHQECWELLPWYVNGTLESDERAAVEEHLGRCPLCRSELAASEEMAVAVRRAAELPPPASARIDHLLARLDGADPGPAAAPPRPAAAAHGAAPAPPRASAAVRWTIALQAAAILALAVGLGSLLARQLTAPPAAVEVASGAPAFRTLASSPAAAAPAQRVRVVFDPAASEDELRRLLLAAGARFAAGPSPAGVYTLELAGEEGAAEALATLRAHPRVELAEPVVVEAAAGGEP